MKDRVTKMKNSAVSAAMPENRGDGNPSGYAEEKAESAAMDTGHEIAGLIRTVSGKGKVTTTAGRESSPGERQVKTKAYIRMMDAKKSAKENAASRPVGDVEGVYTQPTIKTRTSVTSQAESPARSSESPQYYSQTIWRGTEEAPPRISTVKQKEYSVKQANSSNRAYAPGKVAERAKKVARAKAIRNRAAVLTTKKAAKRQAAKRAARAGRRSARYIRAIIAAFKRLILAIAASGAGIVVFAVMICVIAAIVCSPFGIGFSGEKTPNVIAEINKEYDTKIEGIISNTAHDELEVTGARAPWREILAIYAVRMNLSANKTAAASEAEGENIDVAGYTDLKKQELSNIFWNMNTVTHNTVIETVTYTPITPSAIDESGWEVGEPVTKSAVILRISTSAKSYTEMMTAYSFTEEQREYVAELLDPKNADLLEAALYGMDGTGTGSKSIVEVAEKYIGNIGGEIFWRWMGFDSRVSWCACFVSYCANEAGYIKTGILPKSASCEKAGKGSWIHWLKERGLWREAAGYTPRVGDLIFFDWGGDGLADHIGIVEYVKDGTVHTIEGNTSDMVARRSYALTSNSIKGYGAPNY
jgi:hypothetical protein